MLFMHLRNFRLLLRNTEERSIYVRNQYVTFIKEHLKINKEH